MATNAQQPVTEIIPSTKMDGLENALAELREEAGALPILRKQAVELAVTDESTYQKAGELLLQVRGIGKSGALKINPFLDIANRVANFLRNARSRHEDEAKAVADVISGKMADQKRREREAAEAETRRMNEEARIRNEQEAEARRKADREHAEQAKKERVKEINRALRAGEITKKSAAKLLREAGAMEEAAKEQAEADAEETKAAPPVVKVESSIKPIAGTRARIQYEAKIENPDMLFAAYVAATNAKDKARAAYLRRFLMVDESALGLEARTVKNSAKLNAEIPGVRFSDKDKI